MGVYVTSETNLILVNSRFKEDIERKLGRKVGKGERGRPRKSKEKIV